MVAVRHAFSVRVAERRAPGVARLGEGAAGVAALVAPIFDFLIPNLPSFMYGLPSFMYAPFWFALELGLEGPPGLLADGHLLPDA